MTKKSFKGNPALSFISQESIDKAEGTPKKTTKKAAKKAPAGFKPNPEFIETRSKRVQLLIQPSVYTAAKKRADDLGISFNDFINRVIQDAIE